MGKIVITDEAGAPATPADGVTLYSVGSELRYLDESGVVQKIATDSKTNIGSNAITNIMLAPDVKIGSLTTLTTDMKTSATAAINEVDAHADTAAAAAAQATTRIGDAASISGSIGISIDTDGTLKVNSVDVPDVLANEVVTLAKLAADVKKALAKPTNLYSILAPPEAFAAAGWTPITIFQDSDGKAGLGAVSLLDIPQRGNGVWYLDVARPDNNGDGLSWATAERGINYAVQDANGSISGGTIWVADGIYTYPDAFLSLAVSRNIAIRAANSGKVIFSNHRTYSWELDGVYAQTYVATHGLGGPNHFMVCDASVVDALGDYQQLVKRANIAEVNSNAGSWFNDSTHLYVRLHNDRAPDTNLRPYWSGSGSTLIRVAAGAPTILFEGIRFEGGGVTIQAESGGVAPSVYFYNCAFKYASDNGLNNVGSDTYCENCVAARCINDGFHYAERATNVRQARAVEINCIGRHNGDGTDHIDNGSTGHNASLIIRLGGNYYGNYGRNVHDVGPGLTKSWNIGCWSHDSASPVNDISIGCGTGNSDQAQMWLDNCRTSGSAYALDNVTGTTIFTRVCTLREGANAGTGTIVEY